MKRIKLMSVLILALLVSFTGCGQSGPSSAPSQPAPASPGQSASVRSSSQGSAPEEKEFKFEKNVTLLLPYAPGSVSDVYGRMFARVAEKYVGQTILCDNKTGGSGIVSINYMLAQPADGHTIAYISGSIEHLIASGQSEGIDENSIEALANLCSDFTLLSTYVDSPFNSLSDVVEYCRANPGKLNLAGAQSLGTQHFLALLMQKLAGVELNFVVYENGSETLLSTIGKNTDACLSTSSPAMPYYESKDLKPLGQTGLSRNELFPEIETFEEIMPGFGANGLSQKYVFINPASDESVKQAWDKVILDVVNDPEWIEFATSQNQMMDMFMARPEAGEFFKKAVQEAREIFAELL